MEERIQIFKPWFGQEEYDALREPLQTGWLGTGPKVHEFEIRFAEYVGVKHAVALNSATAALHLAMLVTGVEGREVLTTSMTFVSSNHAIRYADGYPVFCDIEEDTLNLDAGKIEAQISERARAILVVHYGGHACDMDPIIEIARKFDLAVIEDVAQACGGSYRGRKLGGIGDVGCFSFESKKNLSTGDGGMLTTNDDIVAERVRRLKWMGISRGTWERFHGLKAGRSWEYDVTEFGFKYQMNDIAGSLGLVQLGKLDQGNAMRRKLLDRYRKAFAQLDGVELLAQRDYAGNACYSAVIQLNERDALCDFLAARGIESGVHFYPSHLYPIYQPYNSAPLPVTEAVWERILTLPLYPQLTEEQQNRVIAAVKSFSADRREVAQRT